MWQVKAESVQKDANVVIRKVIAAQIIMACRWSGHEIIALPRHDFALVRKKSLKNRLPCCAAALQSSAGHVARRARSEGLAVRQGVA